MKRNAYITPETTRTDRMHNIALLIATNFAIWRQGGKDFLRLAKLRELLRHILKLPVLQGEDNLGDLRAHGDACGGHGLHLQIKKLRVGTGRAARCVELNAGNLDICKRFLERAQAAGVVQDVQLPANVL